MTKTIFKNTIYVGLLVLAICAVLFFGMQYTQISDQAADALLLEASCVEKGVMMNGIVYLEKLDTDDRVTWMDANGNVLYDSESLSSLSGETDFEEIQSALEKGEGQAVWKSKEDGQTYSFCAIRCEDGSVLRLGRPLSVLRLALVSASPVLWVLVLVMLIAGAFAFRASRQIVTPVNNLNLDHLNEIPYPELRPLLDKIQEQRLTIQEEAASREEMRREFSANVSHELKTPLTSISGFAELMSQGVVSEDKVEEFAKDIYQESQRLIALIDDIIKLSKLDEEAVVPQKEQVDLYELSLDVADSLRNVADRNNISIDIQGEHASVSGVYQLLYEMLFNLCDNAIKYNYPGGNVTIAIDSDEKATRLSVEDTGIGIGKEHQKRVFERFYRVDQSHSREMGGTGLGLSIVKHGALYHNADVELHSEEGVGTKITVIFPLDEMKETAVV